jgi:hypothetical protein
MYINAATGPNLSYLIIEARVPNIKIKNEVGIAVIRAPGCT